MVTATEAARRASVTPEERMQCLELARDILTASMTWDGELRHFTYSSLIEKVDEAARVFENHLRD